jgi:hypothetical protein
MPSGNRVLIDVYSWGMNMNLYVSGFNRTEGLCGSYDGNPRNDLRVQSNSPNVISPIQSELAVIESWRYFLRNVILFRNYKIRTVQSVELSYCWRCLCT